MTTLIDAVARAIAGHVGFAYDQSPPHRRSYIEHRNTHPEWDNNTVTQSDLLDAAEAVIKTINATGTHVVVPVADLEKLACRHVKNGPLWWQEKARAMLKAASGI